MMHGTQMNADLRRFIQMKSQERIHIEFVEKSSIVIASIAKQSRPLMNQRIRDCFVVPP